MSISHGLISTLADVKTAENEGKYESAFTLLSTYWDDSAQHPRTVGLTAPETAELFLRFGGIIGFLGNSQRISNSQEISKNLLSQARLRFITLELIEKAAECENYLALAYSRTGEFSEAWDWLSESLSRTLPEHHPVRLQSYVVETLLLTDRGSYERVIARGEQLAEIFEAFASDNYNGCLANHMGMACENLGRIDEALDHFSRARNFFRLAGHESYQGTIENNLALLLKHIGRFDEAHECALNAKTTFERIGDRVREGFCLETRAQIFAAEKKFDNALLNIDSAIDLLEGGESYRKLVDSYRTKIDILIRLDRISEALTTMTAAHNLAALYISQELSREIIEGVAESLRSVIRSA